MNEDRLTRIEAILRDVTIVSEAFIGQRPLARHRMIYDALGTMMDAEIHALRIDAQVPRDDI
jgi:BolA protein